MSAAVLTDRGRTVRMMVSAALPGYTELVVWAVHESRTAVLVEFEEVDLHPGARVLLRADGLPVEVVSAG